MGNDSMRWRDTANGYGWISIALHWLTAAVVIALWVLGTSTQSLPPEQHLDAVRAHTSVAVSAYALLWIRIVWRFVSKHPGPLPKQRGFFFKLGKVMHYAMLAAIATMLLSGPLMAWSTGGPIRVFTWSIPSPLQKNTELWMFLHSIHASTATFIVTATLLHIGGVFKHVAFNRDGTFTKMMVPGRSTAIGSAEHKAGGGHRSE